MPPLDTILEHGGSVRQAWRARKTFAKQARDHHRRGDAEELVEHIRTWQRARDEQMRVWQLGALGRIRGRHAWQQVLMYSSPATLIAPSEGDVLPRYEDVAGHVPPTYSE
jgi:hypothetical protein